MSLVARSTALFPVPRAWRRAVLVLGLVAGWSAATFPVRAETWAEKLGYPPGKRVLIFHADDIGMCYEANEAAKRYLPAGEIQSIAMMVPCPWFNEIAGWYKEHPDYDCGLHLAMNSEWRWYRWPSVAPREQVPGMIDSDGYLYGETLMTALKAKPSEIETEIRAQIERALSRGIRPSHIDTHMGTLYARPDFTAAYAKLAVEYRIPAMIIEHTPKIVEKFRQRGIAPSDALKKVLDEYPLPKLDDFDSVPEGKTYEEKRDAFFLQVKNLDPGITEIIFHPSLETEGLKQITNSWPQRVWEAQLFSDPVVKQFFASEGLLFTNWKEMMQRWEEHCPDQVREVEGLRQALQQR